VTDVLIEEVVVTARKREENLQTTPISISAFSGEALEARGITNLEELAGITPNLVIQNNPSFGGSNSSAAVFIRGVGQKDFLATVEPGVGLYIDGVYIARSVGALLDLVDVGRIEVLRGPQGTLFGRNTIGGAISITTRKPDQDLRGSASVTYGTDTRLEVSGGFNLPFSETFFVKANAARLTRDGYVTQVATNQDLGNQDTWTGRLAARWLASDTVEFNLAVDGTRDRDNGPPIVLRRFNTASQIFNPDRLPLLPPGSPATPGFYIINPPADAPVDNFGVLHNYVATLILGAGNCLGFGSPEYAPEGDQTNPACWGSQYYGEGQNINYGGLPSLSNNDIWGITFTTDWDINSSISFKSITAYREVESEFQRDDDVSPLLISHVSDELDQHQFSQEFQLLGSSLDKRINWIAGVYYFDEKAVNPNIVDFTPVRALSGGTVENESQAVFAQMTFDATDSLSLTAGLRYTKDKKNFLPQQSILDGRLTGLPVGFPILPEVNVMTTDSKSTPMVNVAYNWTDEFMTYVSYSKGFKSGGFTQRVFPPLPETPTFGPETVSAYEAGFKLTAFESSLRLNGAAYYTDYKNLQVQVFTGVAPVFRNAAKAEVQGIELEVQAAPGQGWFLEAGAGLTDPEFKEIGPGANEITLDSKFEKVSRWMTSAAVSKEFILGDLGVVVPRIDWSWREKYYNDARNNESLAQDAYDVVNANIAWYSGNENWRVTMGVDNVFDDDYIIAGLWNPNVGAETVMPNRGRQWYVTLKADF
jgi:iron complex outermembrane receptor protein